MTGKIFRSAFFTSVLVLIACFVLIVGVLFDFFENQIKKELESEANYIAYAIQDGNKDLFEDKLPDGKRITLIAQDGSVLADTGRDVQSMDNHADRAEFQQAEQYGSGSSVRYSETLTEKTMYYAKRLSDGSVLRVSTNQYTIVTIILGLIQPLIIILVIALAISIFLSSRVAKSVIKPINEINLDNPEDSDTYDELSPLLNKIVNQNRLIKKQLETAKQAREEFRLITENMSEGFLIIDKNSRLLSCNTSALQLLDAHIMNAESVLALNRSSDFRHTIDTTLSGKRAENIMQHGESTYNLIANPVMEKDKIIGAVIVIIDITESAKREAIRREFTANVSHELKTPLTSISGFTELMKEGGIPEETVKDFSDTIYTEAQRLITLVSDIIKISELDERSEQFVSEDVDLYEMSADIIKRLKITADKKKITMKLSGDRASVYGVRQILEEMVYNLCDNAVKYNKENGTVNVNISSSENEVRLCVADTGIGIPASEQNRIFERFYRVDKSRSKAEGGTGLGLSIVKHGAMYHNADISVKSTVGKGTEITLTFKKKEI